MNSSLTSTPPLAFPVLVVIPCLNEAAHIDNLVAEMLRQIAGSGSRIVIADGGSTDGTVDLARQAAARHPEVTYMHNPKRIQSAAANLAVEQYGSDYEFWLRIDAHADYPADFIAALTQEAAQSGASSIVVPMETIGKTPRQQAIAAAQNSRLGNGGSQHRQGSRGKGSYVDHGHHALMRISAFLEVGGYDESFSHNEDAELDVRLGRAGHRIWLTGDTCMTYYPRAAFLPLARQYVGYGAGRARTLLKHRIRPRLRQVLPALLLPGVAAGAAGTGQPGFVHALWTLDDRRSHPGRRSIQASPGDPLAGGCSCGDLGSLHHAYGLVSRVLPLSGQPCGRPKNRNVCTKGRSMTRQDPAISVVITCYNYAGFVGTAIRSVLDQEGATAELIVVDDASSDSSREVISGFGDQIKALFQEANGGHGAAFNAGYEASTGDIVMFLDADDFLLPGALARVVADFDPEVPMCQYRMNLVDGAGRAYDIFPKLEQPFLSGDQKPRLLRTGRVPTTVTSGLVFSRRFLEQVMPMPPEAFRQGADGYLATLAPLFGPLADGGPEPLAAYRQHGQNHSGFGAVIEKRALWCVQHDEARYDALRVQAARRQEVPAATLGWSDEGYLSQKMALILNGLHPQPQPSRLRLSLAALRVMREQPASMLNRAVISLWWLGLAILPVSLARHLHAWKLYAATRPAWLKWSARKLRRL